MDRIYKICITSNFHILSQGPFCRPAVQICSEKSKDSKEITQAMNIPDLVLLSLYMSSGGYAVIAHDPQQIFQSYSIYWNNLE